MVALVCAATVGVFVPSHVASATESLDMVVQQVEVVKEELMVMRIEDLRLPALEVEGLDEGPLTAMSWPVAGSWNDSCGFGCGCASHGGNHKGKDLGTYQGTPPIVAAGAGRVIATELGYNSGNGNMVIIDHGYGIVSQYAHLSSIMVSVGQMGCNM